MSLSACTSRAAETATVSHARACAESRRAGSAHRNTDLADRFGRAVAIAHLIAVHALPVEQLALLPK
jgi:hypothetical protein